MICSNEPGYYKAGEYGIRIENLIVVRPVEPEGELAGELAGAERPLLEFEPLTLVPIDRSVIERALLNDAEAAWVDAYHARVRESLSPLLDEAARRWLEQATAPL
jgi:Xaa-Pro aminopeptidase